MKWNDPHVSTMMVTAHFLALWLHRDQEDLQGEPYSGHMGRVADYVINHGGSPEQIAAAWLHDSIEDGLIDYDTLYSIFPGNVTTWVFVLARDKESENYQEYIDRLCAVREIRPALLIKLGDILDNMDRSRGPAPERLIKRYEAALPKIRAALGEAKT